MEIEDIIRKVKLYESLKNQLTNVQSINQILDTNQKGECIEIRVKTYGGEKYFSFNLMDQEKYANIIKDIIIDKIDRLKKEKYQIENELINKIYYKENENGTTEKNK